MTVDDGKHALVYSVVEDVKEDIEYLQGPQQR